MFRVRSSGLRLLKPAHTTSVSVVPPKGLLAEAKFTTPFFEVEATIEFDDPPSHGGAGYRVGFTQLQWIETNRATYRGLHHGDGRSRVRRDRPPARPSQACRDVYSTSDVFSFPAGEQALHGYMPHHRLNYDLGTLVPVPKKLLVSHADAPRDGYPVARYNTQTGKMNYLEWAQLEFHFCTVLLLRRQDGSLHQLQHFYWNAHWNVNFFATPVHGGVGATVAPVPSTAHGKMNFGRFIAGDVADHRFAALIAQASAPTCNYVANASIVHQAIQEWS